MKRPAPRPPLLTLRSDCAIPRIGGQKRGTLNPNCVSQNKSVHSHVFPTADTRRAGSRVALSTPHATATSVQRAGTHLGTAKHGAGALAMRRGHEVVSAGLNMKNCHFHAIGLSSPHIRSNCSQHKQAANGATSHLSILGPCWARMWITRGSAPYFQLGGAVAEPSTARTACMCPGKQALSPGAFAGRQAPTGAPCPLPSFRTKHTQLASDRLGSPSRRR